MGGRPWVWNSIPFLSLSTSPEKVTHLLYLFLRLSPWKCLQELLIYPKIFPTFEQCLLKVTVEETLPWEESTHQLKRTGKQAHLQGHRVPPNANKEPRSRVLGSGLDKINHNWEEMDPTRGPCWGFITKSGPCLSQSRHKLYYTLGE